MRVLESHDWLVDALPWTWLDALGSSVLVCDRDYRLLAINDGWSSFADANGGAPAPLGSCLRAIFARIAAELTSVLETGEPWDYDYDCSSPNVERRFRMRVYRVSRELLLMVHSPTFIGEPGRHYRSLSDAHGILTVCFACRRVRTGDDWVWVKSLAQGLPDNASAGLCELCYELAPVGIFRRR